MANWCAIDVTLTLKNEKTAKSLYDALEQEKEEECLDFHGDVVFCNADITLEPKFGEIKIYADVKWAFDCDDMICFVKWLGQFVPVLELTASVSYEEPGCCIFGKYTLNNGILEDHYLEDKDLPKSPDYDDDEAYSAYYDEIYAKIDDKEGKLIYNFNEGKSYFSDSGMAAGIPAQIRSILARRKNREPGSGFEWIFLILELISHRFVRQPCFGVLSNFRARLFRVRTNRNKQESEVKND